VWLNTIKGWLVNFFSS